MFDGMFNRLGRQAERLGSRARAYGEDAAGELRDRGGDARGELRRLYGRMEEILDRQVAPAASDAARVAGRYAERYAEVGAREGRALAEDAADRLSSATRSQPLLMLGIAVGATFIVASLLRRR